MTDAADPPDATANTGYQPIVVEERPMQCPECGKSLARYDHRDKWRCKTCNGVLVGHAQLQIELGDFADAVLEDASDPDRVATRPCPVCAFAMSPYTLDPASAGGAGIELDRCENDAIVWFDGGEIGKLRKRIAEATAEEPFITHIVETVIEVAAEEQLLAAGAFDEIPPAEPLTIDPQEWQERKLCPDGACNGVIGADGACNVCGKSPSTPA